MKVAIEVRRWINKMKRYYGRGRKQILSSFVLDNPWMWNKNDKSKKNYKRNMIKKVLENERKTINSND